MKKLFFTLGSLLVLLAGLSSCAKKEYTCQCAFSGGVQRILIPDVTKSQAQTICAAYAAYEQGQTRVATCKLD
jgi:hypothetical protein